MAASMNKLVAFVSASLSRRAFVPVRKEVDVILRGFHSPRNNLLPHAVSGGRCDGSSGSWGYLLLPCSTTTKVCSTGFQRCLAFAHPRRHYSEQTNTSPAETEEDKLYKWIELKVKGHDAAVLSSYQTFVLSAAKELDIKAEILKESDRDIYRLTLLKSRHIYKKHRVQYEVRTLFRRIKLKHLTGTTADVFLEYIERNLPEGLAMQVKKCSLERLPEHLSHPPEDVGNSPEDSIDQTERTEDTSSDSESSSDSDSESSSDSDSDSEGDANSKS